MSTVRRAPAIVVNNNCWPDGMAAAELAVVGSGWLDAADEEAAMASTDDNVDRRSVVDVHDATSRRTNAISAIPKGLRRATVVLTVYFWRALAPEPLCGRRLLQIDRHRQAVTVGHDWNIT